MRLFDYINESSFKDFDKLKKDCQPFIKELNSPEDFIYSGRRTTDTYIKKKVRKDRKPLDTPISIHNTLNDFFKKKFGHKLRSESLFVTKDPKLTQDFGYRYIILPVGKYSLYVNKDITDLTWYLSKYLINAYEIELAEFDSNDIDVIEGKLDWIVDGYKKVKMNQLDTGNETMLLTDEYYGIRCLTKTSKQDIFDELKGL